MDSFLCGRFEVTNCALALRQFFRGDVGCCYLGWGLGLGSWGGRFEV